MTSFYNRDTELRNVHTKDVYNLALILDDDNYWQILMEIIPYKVNNKTFGSTAEDLEIISLGAAYKRKYTNDHIRLIENAIRRPGETRLHTQILFDEWGSSGRKHERPTLGVLLHLLVHSKLYRAADFVAQLLNAPKPPRPNTGPAAEFKIDIFKDIEETLNDTYFYPNTEELQENVSTDINRDYYTKYFKNVDKSTPTINQRAITTITPKSPPSLLKSKNILEQERQFLEQQLVNQSREQTTNISYCSSADVEDGQLNTQSSNDNISTLSSVSSNVMPNLSALINTINISTVSGNDDLLPKLSMLNSSSQRIYPSYKEEDDNLNSTSSLIYTKSNICENHEEQNPDINVIPTVVLSKSVITEHKTEDLRSDRDDEIHDLPALSALIVNSEKVHVKLLQTYDFKNIPSVALNFIPGRRGEIDECAVSDEDLNIPFSVANMNYNQNLSRHQLEALEEDCDGVAHDRDNDIEVELENVVLSKSVITEHKTDDLGSDKDDETHNLPALSALIVNGEKAHVELLQTYDFKNIPSVALNLIPDRRGEIDECAVSDEDLNIPFSVANMGYNQNLSRHQLEALDEDCDGVAHDRDNDNEVELENVEECKPNLFFLDTSQFNCVTKASGEIGFEQSINDCK